MNIAAITQSISTVGRTELLLKGIISEERLQELVLRAEDLGRIEKAKNENAEIVHLNILVYQEDDEIGYYEEEIGGFEDDFVSDINWSCKEILMYEGETYAVEVVIAIQVPVKN